MQLLKYIYDTVINGITNFILFITNELSKIPFLGARGAVIVIYAIYLLALILFSVFGVSSFINKKYKTSLYFLLAALIMIGYFLILSYNIGHKAD